MEGLIFGIFGKLGSAIPEIFVCEIPNSALWNPGFSPRNPDS